eukprot:3698108-Prymnesium_polylepis.1
MTRAHVRALLANCLLLNVKRGSALDWLGGGPDPLFVSGAKLAEPKLLCVMAFLARATGAVPIEDGDGEAKLPTPQGAGGDDELVEFVRARAQPAAAESLRATEVRPTDAASTWALRSGLELYEADEDECTDAQGATSAVVASSVRGAPFGGGPLQGSSATEEECTLLSYPEALPALWLFGDKPAAVDEVLLVRGVRLGARCTGAPHELAFVGLAPPTAPPTTLLCLDASRTPGPAQFAAEHVQAELEKAATGFAVLRAEVGAPRCVVGLWGCGGFSGAQPLFRTLLLFVAASATDATLVVRLSKAEAERNFKWFAGVLSELRARAPTPLALQAMLSSEVACRSERLSRDVPAFASFVIKALRTINAPAAAPAVAKLDGEDRARQGDATAMGASVKGEAGASTLKRPRPPDLARISTAE